MKIIKWIVILVIIGVIINLIDTPFIRGSLKIIIGWGVIFLAIIGLFSIMNKQ